MQLRKNPLGDYVGKIGNTVGGKWKGIYWVRTLIYPTQKGTVSKYKLYKMGAIPAEQFSFPQMNIRRLVLSPMGFMALNALDRIIHPVWEKGVRRYGKRFSGVNYFIQKSANEVFNSMPHKDQEYNPSTNAPDYKKMLVSYGPLDKLQGVNYVKYDTATGKVTVQWQTGTLTNGKFSDYVFCVVMKKPLLNGEDDLLTSDWSPAAFLYGTALLPEPPEIPKNRGFSGDWEITGMVPAGLLATDLIGYVFCRDAEGKIGYSPSIGIQVTTA